MPERGAAQKWAALLVMKIAAISVLLCVLLGCLFGCAVRKELGPNIIVDIPCLTGPIELQDCDMGQPTKCHKVKIPRKCERVDARKSSDKN